MVVELRESLDRDVLNCGMTVRINQINNKNIANGYTKMTLSMSTAISIAVSMKMSTTINITIVMGPQISIQK